MVVGFRPAKLVDHGQVLLQVVWDAVEEEVLVDRSIRAALAGCAVVGDHDHQRVVPLPGVLQVLKQPPDVMVGVRQEPRVHLGHPGEQPLLVRRQRVPRLGVVQRRKRLAVRTAAGLGGAERVGRGKPGVGRDDAQLLLPDQGLLPDRLIAHVELPGVPVDPLARRMMRRMARAGRVVEEERLVRRDRLGVFDEFDRLVGNVVGEVVTLLGRAWLVDGMIVVDQFRVPLVGLRA